MPKSVQVQLCKKLSVQLWSNIGQKDQMEQYKLPTTTIADKVKLKGNFSFLDINLERKQINIQLTELFCGMRAICLTVTGVPNIESI